LGRDVLEYELWIYNRWGELVFHSTDFNLGWDGSYKGIICPEGVYMYKVQYSGYGKPQWTKVFRTGVLHLVR
jgi:gliding motility-associated-like protein